ncbi:hypothetical protein DICSQDRAFT_143372 [Dichomitus squalens LYAD-421 SS1]|uniref:uncharacterized protein n=1 Tax=Dichomitus squalens (strain LYAD-421) TaxID=732165 RepID=UPI0004413BAA|nr:uncharacterized protein DICSQDRAFT_143372 [Dichomitus squalens LYAD-421 SS1]EJF66014.1 hypothetical protein DICSQDRAFT_143372 [Dichomitus squalens LYAD-421 SS1]
MAVQWDTGRAKAQLRLTAQRLGQLQDRMDSQAQITQRDVATLLQQGNIALARAKAQKLMKEDVKSDLLQTLEMHVGVILGHLNELERSDTPSPIMTEAASSIIYAGLQIESKDLHNVREFLMQALGPDFTRSAITNQDNHVSSRVLRAVNAPPPTAARLDAYLYGIARTYNVQWLPDLSPEQKVNALSPIVDPEIVNEVDLANLRRLCAHGLPSHPPWLRPRVWRLLLGTLPVDKAAWRKESRTQRDNYYDLVRRLLEPLSSLPDPIDPLSSTDQAILDVFNELSMVPPSLLATLEEESEPCPQCPLDEDALEDIKIACAGHLDARLRVIRAKEAEDSTEPSSNGTPEIRLDTTPEIRLDATPEVRLEEPSPTKTEAQEHAVDDTLSVPDSEHSGVSTTLLPSRQYTSFSANNKHSSALLRLLYIHSCLNPANRSPQIGSLLVPIYAAFVEEVDPEDVPHVEADTFWVFESMVGEFSELEDEQNGTVWVQKLSDRLRWADDELADDLATKGLDPGLPHYSFRWLIPLLTHTLPLPAVLMVWDALFSRPMRQRDENPKLEYLVDVCTSMLVSARGTLLQLGRGHRKQQYLWSDEVTAIPSTAFGERELEEAFIEGMAFLQKYPLDAVGGIEKVLQTAYDLASQRAATVSPTSNGAVGLGARLRDTVWKSMSSSLESHPEEEDESEEETDEEYDENPTPQPQSSTLSARLANTVWRGITNQSAVDVPSHSPSPTSSPLPSPGLVPSLSAPPVPPKQTVVDAAARGKNMFWGYAEKLKDSDAAATFAKVSTNWRVKALDAWSKPRTEAPAPLPSPLPPPAASQSAPSLSSIVDHARSISLTALTRSSPKPPDDKRGSLPLNARPDNYSPPPRPAVFRPVRDSIFVASPISRSNEPSPVSDSGSMGSQSLRGSLSSSFKLPSDKAASRSSSGPRPLLLNSSSLLTGASSPASPARSPISPSAESKWVESVRAKRSIDHRASQSSISSLSPSETFRPKRVGTQSDFDSDSGSTSRVVPINRNKSPSPMARVSRRPPSRSSISPPSPPKTHRRLPTESSAPEDNAHGGWARVEPLDSPTTIASPPPGTPDAATTLFDDVRVKQPESQRQRGSVVLPESNDITLASPAPESKLARRSATISRAARDAEASDSSATEPASKNPNLRRKRFPPRLQSLRNSRSTPEPVPALPTHSYTLDVPADDHEVENATTPRANTFDAQMVMPPSPRSRRTRKISGGEGEAPARTRKISNEGRTRKLSNEGRRKVSAERDTKQKRESAAVEGDDEGYNDLLSAYESEDAV